MVMPEKTVLATVPATSARHLSGPPIKLSISLTDLARLEEPAIATVIGKQSAASAAQNAGSSPTAATSTALQPMYVRVLKQSMRLSRLVPPLLYESLGSVLRTEKGVAMQ